MNFFFDQSNFNENNIDKYLNTSILTPLNEDVIKFNEHLLNTFESNNEDL